LSRAAARLVETGGIKGRARAALEELFRVDNAEWREEEAAIGEYLAGYGSHLPDVLKAQHQRIVEALIAEAEPQTVPARKAAAS